MARLGDAVTNAEASDEELVADVTIDGGATAARIRSDLMETLARMRRALAATDWRECPNCGADVAALFPPDGEHDPETCEDCKVSRCEVESEIDGPWWWETEPRKCPECGALIRVESDGDGHVYMDEVDS